MKEKKTRDEEKKNKRKLATVARLKRKEKNKEGKRKIKNLA